MGNLHCYLSTVSAIPLTYGISKLERKVQIEDWYTYLLVFCDVKTKYSLNLWVEYIDFKLTPRIPLNI